MRLTEFIDEEIEVSISQKPGPPTSFVWRENEYKITEIRQMRRVLDFKAAWWRRRHRDYYVVKTDAGEAFEIYFHRGFGRRYWVLLRRLEE